MKKQFQINAGKRRATEVCFRVLASFWGAWAVIFLCWLPAYLASWPGIFVIDNVFQMKWFLEGNISAHHPILHTYLLGGILSFGKSLLGTYEAGMCIFSVLQMLFLSAVFAYMMKKLEDHMSRRFRIICVLMFAIIPYNPVSAFTTTKDTVYAGFFLLVVLHEYLLICEPEVFFSSKKRMAEFVALVFLMCAFRNTGIYIFVFSLPAFVIVCRKYWKKVLAVALSCIVLWGLYTGPVYNLLDVQKGSSAEILSVPIQQLARVMTIAPEELTEGEKQMIAEYMPDYSRYVPRVSDPVKDSFNADLVEQEPMEFVKLWIRVGLKCPIVYLEAFLSTNVGFWNPFMQYPDKGTYLPYIPYFGADLGQVGVSWEGQVFIERNSLVPGLSVLYEKMTETGDYNRIPGMRFVYSIAVAFWLIVAGIVYCIRKKRYKMALPFFTLIGLWGTLMLSPVVVFRYGYPLIISLPVVCAMCRGKNVTGYPASLCCGDKEDIEKDKGKRVHE